jgi:thiol-disulfide isomerase/thioredoxin
LHASPVGGSTDHRGTAADDWKSRRHNLASSNKAKEMPHLNSPLPSFDGVSHWRNGPAPTKIQLAGKPVLLHFFSSGCPLCHEGMPVVRRIHAAYASRGLIVIGAYQPRQNVKASLADAERECDLHIGPTHACALDADGTLAERFGNEWSPAYCVYDRSNRLRHYQMGNWNLKALDAIIQGCLREPMGM